jgi:ribokinase
MHPVCEHYFAVGREFLKNLSVMKVINFGSLNFDRVYEVEHLVQPGETITAKSYHRLCGGKGLNQSIALARAGAPVFHAGKVGSDGEPLIACLKSAGVDTTHIGMIESKPSGHAMIQVDRHGQNSIIIHGGANREIQKEDAGRVLGHFSAGDYLMLQNEIRSIPDIIVLARKRGMTIFLNPAPMDKTVLVYPLDLVDYFFINEIEGRELTGETEPRAMVEAMRKRFPRSATILTLGENGVIYADQQTSLSVPAEKVTPVDTTAAGDTFIGFFIAQTLKGETVEKCLQTASRAAAICVTRHGAADSIPRMEDVVK